MSSFANLQADGSTACGCWIYTGYFANNDAISDPAKQKTGSRDNVDKPADGFTKAVGNYSGWSWAWPANRRRARSRRARHELAGRSAARGDEALAANVTRAGQCAPVFRGAGRS